MAQRATRLHVIARCPTEVVAHLDAADDVRTSSEGRRASPVVSTDA